MTLPAALYGLPEVMVLVSASAAFCVAVAVACAWALTVPPPGRVPDAVAVLVRLPASTLAWVTV